MLAEFKKFALRGNVLDLAVGVIIGAAFGRIVTSLVNGIIMPPFGLLLGGVNFQDIFFPLDGKTYASLAAATDAGAPVIALGAFINEIINFIIVAFVIFLLVRWFNSMKKPEPVAAVTTKECPYCASTIALKATRCPECTSQL